MNLDWLKQTEPNHLYKPGGVTFVFTKNNKLYLSPYPSAHMHLLNDENIWKDVVGGDEELLKIPPQGLKRRAIAEKYALLGRIGPSSMLSDYNPGPDPNVNVVILWGDDVSEVNKLKIPALKSMLKNGSININDYVTGFVINPGTVGDHLGGKNIKSFPTPDREFIDLRRQLHILPPEKKQLALKKLCIQPASPKCRWAMELAKIGAPSPFENVSHEYITFSEWLKNNS